MPLEVAEETDLEGAQPEALALLSATRSIAVDAARYDWLYLRNPDGPAVMWSLRESPSGRMVGFTVALPRRIHLNGRCRTCWNCADFSIDRRYRTLGPALKLRRAARDDVDAGRVDFLYAHPNPRMAVIHEGVGHSALGSMVRVARVLNAAAYLRAKLPGRAVATAVGKLVEPCLRIGARETRHHSEFSVQIHRSVRFDDRFDRLFEESAASLEIAGVRDARYLNWRYADNPLEETQAALAEESGQLRGWVLFTIRDGVCLIQDVFPPRDATIARDLLAGLLRAARGWKLKSISFTALEGNSWLPVFHEFGFRSRPETGRMFVHAAANHPDRELLLDTRAWHATVGDRDV